MGKKEKYLKRILNEHYPRIADNNYPTINIDTIFKFDLLNEVSEVFFKLGGISNNIKIYHGKWDICKQGFVIELDEQRHFNRYRLETLYSKLYSIAKFEWYQKYIIYCTEYEDKCLSAARYGGNWTNNSCETMFGKSSEYGVLDGNGPSRWKQRAFYDYLKDVNAYINNFKILRISIWDTYNYKGSNYLLKKILEKEMEEAIINYLYEKFTKENII